MAPWWVLLFVIVPEAVLLIPLVSDPLSDQLNLLGHRATVTVALLGVVSLGTGLLLLALIGSLIDGYDRSGGELLAEDVIIWTTNAITFGLWFWNVDRDGPLRRLERNPPPPEFLFPNGRIGCGGTRLAAAALRLHVRRRDQCHCIQPDRHVAAHAFGEAAHAIGSRHLGRHCALRSSRVRSTSSNSGLIG
jgi:hypothetical protein